MPEQLTLTPTAKTCTRCHETKPLDDFGKDKTQQDDRRRICKQCCCAQSRAYREANREKVKEQKRAYYQATREQQNEYHRAYRQTNRERRNEYNRAYRQANPDQKRAETHRRRARQRATVPQRWIVDHNLGDPLACWWCGRGLLGTTTHTDHVHPLKLGGPAHPNNEVTTCRTCNLRKRDSHPLVWIAQLTSE